MDSTAHGSGFLALIRSAIAERHARIEATPLARALATGAVQRERYVALLERLLPLHRAYEPAFAEHAAPFDAIDWRRSADLERDLAALAVRGSVERDVAEADAFAAGLDADSALGAAYVVVGSRHGSHVLRPALASALGVADEAGAGLDYHRELAGFAARWRWTLAALDRLPLDGHAAARVAAGAQAAMDAFARVYDDAREAA